MEYVDPNGRPKIGNARCSQSHPLWLVSEGYAYCYDENDHLYWPWRFTQPPTSVEVWWVPSLAFDCSPAWVGVGPCLDLDTTLEYIQYDMRRPGNVLSIAPPYSEWLATVS